MNYEEYEIQCKQQQKNNSYLEIFERDLMEAGEIVSLSDGTWSDTDNEDEALADEIDTTDKYVRLPNQYDILKDRLRSVIVEFAGFGWGMEDYISNEYYSIPWIGEE